LLKEFFEKQGKFVIIIREPGGTEISEQIRKILLDKKNLKLVDEAEILLFSASRAQLVREKILPEIARGTIVLSDRFYDSTTAYQGAGRGIDANFVSALNKFVAGVATPDITFFLDIPIELALARQKEKKARLDRIESGTSEFYNRIRDGYIKLAVQESRIITIDGSASVEHIHTEIINHILRHPVTK
jgi:dTMP kinase